MEAWENKHRWERDMNGDTCEKCGKATVYLRETDKGVMLCCEGEGNCWQDEYERSIDFAEYRMEEDR